MNTDKAIQRAKISFADKGYCVMDVSCIFADSLARISDKIQSTDVTDWTYVINHSDFSGDLPKSTKTEVLLTHRKKALKENSKGKLAFYFERLTTDHNLITRDTPKALTYSKRLLESHEMRGLLESITSRTVLDIEQMYINRFNVGDFLGVHRDGGNNLGVALNISKDWLTVNGGNTHILNESMEIIDSLSPKYGRILIFDSKKSSVPHFVSSVSATNGSSRMAIVGRYN
ncbi:2OG-Fe(II) oxygenase family protein [Vibrio maritimus]|uniref:2OG-Fe(II) oxygenase family protein n=1 Tax=Vibrio maritimus TaxID=990268 RepID=UPI001F33184B|nr:2OG-Fe(II) oxygenase [Vibrio maritimus]